MICRGYGLGSHILSTLAQSILLSLLTNFLSFLSAQAAGFERIPNKTAKTLGG
jgi:hypothetical protein